MKRKFTAAAALLVICLAGAAVVGCGGGDSSSSSSSSSGETGGESYEIGVVQFSASVTQSVLGVEGLTDYAEEQGWSVTTSDAEGSTDKASSLIQTMVTKGVDEIVTIVFPASALTGGLVRAEAAGIPVVSIGGGAGKGLAVDYDIGTETGTKSTEFAIEQMNGEGEMLVFGYSPGIPCTSREEIFNEKTEATSIKIQREETPIPGQVQAAQKLTAAWLSSHPAGSGQLGVWACFDEPAAGAIAAIQQAGRQDEVPVFSAGDGTPEAIKLIEQGKLTSTAYWDPLEGGKLVGEEVPAVVEAGSDAEAKTVNIPATLITEENVKQFLKEFPAAG